jgi:serine/threonine-protein kinase
MTGDDATLAGRLLADKYLLIERLGEGGFGSIWRAEHQVLKSPVAVKLIDLEVARREGAVERFLREAQATAVLRSPHVVQVLDYGLDKRTENGVEYEQPFIVMELLEGENLADRIARLGKISPLETLRIVTHVARAISRAHELGIVHRDLKPENIFLVNNGDAEVAKVLDFGVAKIVSPMDLNRNTYTQTGSMVGTPYYMSPEQAQGNKTVDYRSDLWALGVITFEMLTGQRPFDSDALGDLVLCICIRDLPIPSHFGPVPDGFDEWFSRAVAREPDARFQSARELASSLLELVENQDGGVRFTQFDDFPSLRPPIVKPIETGIIAEIPSRPKNNAFAATVRDETLANSLVERAPQLPAIPEESPSTVGDDEDDERLAPIALAGMSLLALAAGAAAVYGLFHLLRDPSTDDNTTFESPSASYQSGSSNRASLRAKRKNEIVPPNQPNPTSNTKGRSGSDVGSTTVQSNQTLEPLPNHETAPTVRPLMTNSVSATEGKPVGSSESPKTGIPSTQHNGPESTTSSNAPPSPTPIESLDVKSSTGVSPEMASPKDAPKSLTPPLDKLPMVTD